MLWMDSALSTITLILLTSLVSISIGVITSVSAWWSNKTWAYYMPLLILAVPPWLFTYYLSDQFGYINPWQGAALSLGVCCSVYPHTLISASLANRAHKSWEMLIVTKGKSFKSLFTAIWPSLKISLLPSFAIIAAECIADFGVSNFYGLNTVTMMTYNIWTSTWSLGQLTWGLALLAIMSIIVSRLDVPNFTSIQSDNTNKNSVVFALLAVLPTILLLGFGIFKSLEWIYLGAAFLQDDLVWEFLNTIYLTSIVVVSCVAISAMYLAGIQKDFLERSGLGLYALPGIVIGAIVLYLFGAYVPMFILLSCAITMRYYGLMINTVAVADKGNQKYFEVIDFFTVSKVKKILSKTRLVLPAVGMGTSLIILDVIRELPISMILQPMNFQTLAMRMNYIARNEAIPSLGPHSLIILGLGILFCSVIIKVVYDTNKKSQL